MFYVLGAHQWMLQRQIESAKAVCAPCAVRAKCLSCALGQGGGHLGWDHRAGAARRTAIFRPPPGQVRCTAQ